MVNKSKVLVGISGGVDSSVSALLLKKEGYEVEGIFVKVWQPDFIECNWREEMRDAMRVCAQLEIPFHFLDLEKEYKKDVVDYMLKEYKEGRTPNPDVMCNKYIKFGHLFDFAEKNNFDFIATGHYAQNIDSKLFKGKDENKDQSYFLWSLTKEKLNKIIFPVGHLNKSKVREIAEEKNLFTHTKKDSQGICFMGPVDMKSFLKKYLKTKTGDVLNTNGEIIGKHEGAELYTIGERHGFTIDAKYKEANDKPFFILNKNISDNTITVGESAQSVKEVQEIKMEDFSFIDSQFSQNLEKSNFSVEFQTRYRQNTEKGGLSLKKNILSLNSNNFREIPAIGQSAVFYTGNQCLGGGIIKSIC